MAQKEKEFVNKAKPRARGPKLTVLLHCASVTFQCQGEFVRGMFFASRMIGCGVFRSSRDDHQSGAGDSSETHTVPNGPHFNFLVMSSQGCRGAIADAYANRKRNQRAVDTFMECLRDPDSQDAPQPISAVEVDVVNTRDKFHSTFYMRPCDDDVDYDGDEVSTNVLCSSCGRHSVWAFPPHRDQILPGEHAQNSAM